MDRRRVEHHVPRDVPSGELLGQLGDVVGPREGKEAMEAVGWPGSG